MVDSPFRHGGHRSHVPNKSAATGADPISSAIVNPHPFSQRNSQCVPANL